MFLLFTGCTSLSTSDSFTKLLQYELNNREFAYLIYLDFAEKSKGTEYADFWKAYLSMEQISRPKYQAAAKRYNLKLNMRTVNFNVWTSNIAYTLSLDTYISVMTNATIKYVPKMEKLYELAPEDDKDFFQYVVDQEKTQAQALSFLSEGKIAHATKVIQEFVNQQVN